MWMATPTRLPPFPLTVPRIVVVAPPPRATWECPPLDIDYFYKFSVNGYKVAINVLLYAMTH